MLQRVFSGSMTPENTWALIQRFFFFINSFNHYDWTVSPAATLDGIPGSD